MCCIRFFSDPICKLNSIIIYTKMFTYTTNPSLCFTILSKINKFPIIFKITYKNILNFTPTINKTPLLTMNPFLLSLCNFYYLPSIYRNVPLLSRCAISTIFPHAIITPFPEKPVPPELELILDPFQQFQFISRRNTWIDHKTIFGF